MIAAIQTVVAPTEEPVTLTEGIKAVNGIIAGDEAVFQQKLIAARESAELHMRRSIMTQTLDVWYDRWDGIGFLELPRGNVQSIVDVTTYDYDNLPVVADPGIYALLGDGYSLLFNDWLPPYRPSMGLKVRIVSGWENPEDVPAAIKDGICLYAAFLYEHRIGEAPEVRYAAQASQAPEWEKLWSRYQIRLT